MSRYLADELPSSDAERACLSASPLVSGVSGGIMERHTVRVFLIALRLADDRRLDGIVNLRCGVE